MKTDADDDMRHAVIETVLRFLQLSSILQEFQFSNRQEKQNN